MASKTLTVTSLEDSGAGSLRETIALANAEFGGDLNFAAGDHVDIEFAEGLSGGVIRLASRLSFNNFTDIRIDGDIDGDGTGDITISGDTDGNGVVEVGDSRLFLNEYNSELKMSNLTLTEGYGEGDNEVIDVAGDTVLENVVISDSHITGPNYYDSGNINAATLWNTGSLRLTDVVFEGNTTTGGDGSIPFGGYYETGGLATSGILNSGDITLDSASFEGTATGGQGGPGDAGGDAIIGIYNIYGGRVEATSPAAFDLIGGDGPVAGGAGGEGQADGDTYRGFFGEGSGVFLGANEMVLGTSGDDVEDRSLLIGGGFLGLHGDDEITTGAQDLVFGGAGDDLLIFTGGTGGEDTSLAQGGNGDDKVIVTGSGNSAVGGGGEGQADDGVDTLSFETVGEGVTVDLGIQTQDYVDGSTIDQIQFENLVGTAFADTLTGGDDFAGGTISGGVGGDTLTAGDLGSVLQGGKGKDTLNGSAASDELAGDGGKDDMTGGGGGDDMSGGGGKDDMSGGGGKDNMDGGGGRDDMSGGKGNDDMMGGGGRDFMNGNGGKDKMDGGNGKDVMAGSGGNDKMKGGKGNDVMSGGKGKDNVQGGAGRDMLSGDKKNDSLKGGADADTFYFAKGFDRDTVKDFKTGQGDQVLLDSNLFAGDLSAQGIVDTFGGTFKGKAALKFGDGDTLVFKGIDNIDSLVDFIDIA